MAVDCTKINDERCSFIAKTDYTVIDELPASPLQLTSLWATELFLCSLRYNLCKLGSGGIGNQLDRRERIATKVNIVSKIESKSVNKRNFTLDGSSPPQSTT